MNQELHQTDFAVRRGRAYLFVVLLAGEVFLLTTPKRGEATTYYMPDTFPNLHAALSGMVGGDTLIIRDGLYKGSENTIDASYLPPSGSAGSYTTIKAEHDWKVTFDGENLRAMFYTWAAREYVAFQGIKWINNNDATPHISVWNYVKFIKCAFHCSSGAIRVSTAWISDSSNILLEDCHAWGDGRYSLNVQTSDRVVVRRFVSRLDAVNGSLDGAAYPAAHLMSYASQQVEWQNCIAIDSDQKYFRSPASYYLGGYATHTFYNNEYTDQNYYRGCIAMNIDMHQPNPSFTSAPGPGFQLDRVRSCEYINCVVVDVVGRGFSGSSLAGYPSKIDHCTVKILPEPNGLGDCVNGNADVEVTNSILTNGNRSGIRGGAKSEYNGLYGNSINYSSGSVGGTGDVTNVDPYDGVPGSGRKILKYPNMIEKNTDYSSTGSGGSVIGAVILKRYGVSGTMYGEAGYNQLTAEDLWPFPFEDEIRSDFRTYNVGGTDKTAPLGDRGFCAEGKSLTHTIWGALGNIVPPFKLNAK
ncbi:MAG: hypothetical protein ACYC99_02065 [Candidatus Geothermincolia bacterium]